MADQTLVERKIDASFELTQALLAKGAPLLAAYWEWREEDGRWILFLVPTTPGAERKLVDQASEMLIEPPYRSAFSLSEVVVDAHQIRRAQAIVAYIQRASSLGRRIDTLFTNGEYFDAIVPVFITREWVPARVA